MAARYDHIDFKPPQGAREAAKRALEVRAEKPESERGMTPVGIARARDLANGKTLSPETVRRMKAYFDRHESDKSGETWDSQGKGWQAWQGWGGDAGYAWARKVVRQMEAADAAGKRMSDDAAADGDPGVAVVVPIDEETAEYALPGVGDAHVTLAYLGRRSALPMGAVDLARSIVARWASMTPPMPAAFSGVGRFHGAEDGADAAYLSVDAPGLSAARDALCRALREAGLPVAATHGFTPHATLSYLPADAATPDAPCDLPLALTLDAAAVWCGAEHGEPCALTGSGDPALMSDDDTAANDTSDADDVIVRGPEAMPLAFADGAKASVGHSTWNQIAREAEFLGHGRGPVRFSREVFAEILRNFAANGNGEVPLDYEHTSERLPESAAVMGVPAPGWVTKLEVRNGGRELWALFKWVDADAVRYVREGRYKYVSPAINFKSRDKVTGRPAGARLTSVALTNHPFIEGMQPLAADDRSRALDALLAPLARALNVSVAELSAAVDSLKPAAVAEAATADLAAPAADTLHAPTNTPAAKPTETTMDPNMMPPGAAVAQPEERPSTIPPPPDAEMADLPKMAPAAAPSNFSPEDAAKAKAEKDAAPADDVKRDSLGKFATMQRFAEACGMSDLDPESEGAEDAIAAKIASNNNALAKALTELAQYQEREKAAMAAQAAAMSDRVIAAGLADADAREALTALCLTDRKTFETLYPIAKVEKAEGARAFSDRGGPTRDGAAILTQRVGLAGGVSPRTPDASQTFHDRVEAETARLMTADRSIDRITARKRAEDSLRAAP